jgi:hypothetical protein
MIAISGVLLASAQWLDASPGDHIRLSEGGLNFLWIQ